MEKIKAWVRNIVLIILFANFIEMLLPNSQMRNFVKVVIGFFIILVILNPILSFVHHQADLLSWNYFGHQEATPSFKQIMSTGEELYQQQLKDIKVDYKKKVIKQIKAVIKLNFKIEDIIIDVKLTEDNLIKEIIIKGNKEKIIPVNINLSQEESTKQLKNKELKLQELISSFYGLNRSKVKVNLN